MRAYRPAHELSQLLGDAQPQAGATESSGGAGISLGERLEQRRQAIGLDADTGVCHFEAQSLALGSAGPAGTDDHLACGRELDGVAREVHQHLANARRIPAQHRRQRRIDGVRELEFLLMCSHADDLGHLVDDALEVVVFFEDLELAGLDLREVEDVVDHGHQRVSRGDGDLRVLSLLGGERGVQ